MIISENYLENELSSIDYSSTAGTLAVVRASDKINTWTSTQYLRWDDTIGDVPQAPASIVSMCVELAKAEYFLSTNEANADGDRQTLQYQIQADIELKCSTIKVVPEVVSVAISLDTNGCQLLGTQNVSDGSYPMILPTGNIISGSSNNWGYNKDFYIRRGGSYDGEQSSAYYLEKIDDDLEGTLFYRRAFSVQDYDRHVNHLVSDK